MSKLHAITTLSLLSLLALAACQTAGEDEYTETQYEESADAVIGSYCVPDGGWDDTLNLTRCCSGVAVSGTTVCAVPSDYNNGWASCNHICGTRLVNGCVPSGGVDDTLSLTRCCSGQAVPGSTHCLNPRDYGTSWKSCAQTCQ